MATVPKCKNNKKFLGEYYFFKFNIKKHDSIIIKMKKIYYGSQTKKALINFPFETNIVHKEFILALVEIKKAAAIANFNTGNLNSNVKNAIFKACDKVVAGGYKDQFPLKALQGGAGTSTNMNANEVIASLATGLLKKQGKQIAIHPNDHVNQSQSTNDVNPSALKIACFRLMSELQDTLKNLSAALEKKAKEFKYVTKLARTHLQDAAPTTLGSEFAAYAEIVRQHQRKLKTAALLCQQLNLGGTAIGNSINTTPKYIQFLYQQLNKITKLKFQPASNLMSQTSSQTDFLAISQAVTALVVDLSKIASDFRLMASGPKGGLGEIILMELQKGSSIIPGKINPILPETVNQLYYLVSGNNLTIEHSVHASQLELGVMLPIIADRLLQSLKLTQQVLDQFTKKCVLTIKANKQRCKELLEISTAYSTMLTPKFGYDKVSELVKQSLDTGLTLREVVTKSGLLTDKEFDKLMRSVI